MANEKVQASLPGFETPKPVEEIKEKQPAPKTPEHPDDGIVRGSVYIIDAHALIYQVFHAMPAMSSPSGAPIGAVHGFVRDVADIIEKRQPDYLFAAFDEGSITFRNDLYEDYKANREEMPDDLRPQVATIQRMLRALNIPILSLEGYEADDILATLAEQIEAFDEAKLFLVTNDKDCRQLITKQVSLFNIRKQQVYTAKELFGDWGIRPDQVVDFQALVGDSTDNVPGVALIGPKIAQQLLEEYETLEGVLDNAEKMSGKKRRENLMNGRDIAFLSRDLVRLDREVPIEFDWQAARVGSYYADEVAELSAEFGFKGLGQRLAAITAAGAVVEEQDWEVDYRCVATEAELADLIGELAEQDWLAFDTETTSTNPRWAKLVGLSFCYEEGLAYYIPVDAPEGDPQLPLASTLAALKPIFEDPAIRKIGHNLKYDVGVLRGYDIHVQGVAFDTMIADYLLDAGRRDHSLDDLAKRFFKYKTTKISEIIGKGKNQILMNEAPVAKVSPYACEDADISWRLFVQLQPMLQEQQLEELFTDLEMPLIHVLVEMEYNGITVDADRLQQLSEGHGNRLDILEQQIYDAAGREFDINSPKQLSVVLFEELGLPHKRKTKTGYSTDADVLEELALSGESDLPELLLEYRQATKLKSTYLDALPQLIYPETGRIHTSFRQDVAATGRLSSNEPNLQNIPIRTEDGREIRSAFLAGEPGWKLLGADYSQIELRVLAHFSQDPTLLNAFANGEDIHARVASEVYEVDLAEVTPEMRHAAKAINFGIVYGQTAWGLAKAINISKGEAAEFIDAYFARIPGVETFIDEVLNNAQLEGFVTTIAGRKRGVEGVRTPQRRKNRSRTLPERIAVNTVIQGSAADLIKQAMIDVHDRLQNENFAARLLLQIHDELVLECPESEIESLTAMVRETMIGVKELSVPLVVDIATGDNWQECK